MTRPTDLHDYVEARGSSLRTLRCPVFQLHFRRISLANLSPAVPPKKALWILLGELQVVQLYKGMANLLSFVCSALVRVEPICRLPKMTPQTSFDRTCYCGMCDGERTGCSSFLGEPPPCDGGHTIKWQWLSRQPHLCWQFGWCCLRGLESLPACFQENALSGNRGDTSICYACPFLAPAYWE